MPIILQISAKEYFLLSYKSFANCLFSFGAFFGLHPNLPLDLAAANPDFVLSDIRFLSNSDREANI